MKKFISSVFLVLLKFKSTRGTNCVLETSMWKISDILFVGRKSGMTTLVPRVILISSIIFVGCAPQLSGYYKKPFYRPETVSDQATIDAYHNRRNYMTTGVTFNVPSGEVSFRIFQDRLREDPSKLFSPLKETGYGVAVQFEVIVENNSTRHTFRSYDITDWSLMDNNGHVWNRITWHDASNSDVRPPDCIPGSTVKIEVIFGSAYYYSKEELPERLTLKMSGRFLTLNSYEDKFEKDLMFEKIRQYMW